MKKRIIIPLVILAGLGILSIIIIVMKKKSEPSNNQSPCIISFEVNHYTGMTGDITLEKIRSQDTFLAGYISQPKKLIGVDGKTGSIIVNEKYFSNINKTDATRVYQPSLIGNYKQISSKEYTLRDIVKFILESQLITTYWHLQSNVCLVKETDSVNVYKASFDASHEYCTNECITEKYSFSIEIDKKDGTIMLLP